MSTPSSSWAEPVACFSCSKAAQDDLPVREQILRETGWRLAHAFDTALPGWLVLVPDEHVTALEDLSPDVAVALGGLLYRVSAALRAVLGCTKTYVAFFAEAPGFGHLHVHLVPRMPDLREDQLGPRVFSLLGRPEGERVPEPEQELLAARLRHELGRSGAD